MSVVTDVIVTAQLADGIVGNLGSLNEYFRARAMADGLDPTNAPRFVDVSDFAQSGKAVQACVWLGAFNHLDHSRFLAHVRKVPWYAPEELQVFMNTEHGEEGFQRVEWRQEPQAQSDWVSRVEASADKHK